MALQIEGLGYSLISDCNATTSQGAWTGPTYTADTEAFKHSTASLSCEVRLAGTLDLVFTPTASIDLSGTGVHVRWWSILNQGTGLGLFANGGVQFYATDGVNTGYWYAGGRDTYPGGWYNFVVDVSAGVDSGTKPTSMNAITVCGVRIYLSTAVKKAINTWIDHLCVCDGINHYDEHDTGVATIGANVAGTYTRSAGDYEADGFKDDMQVVFSGFANGGNNGTKYIDSLTTTVITVKDATGMVTESGTGDERVKGFYDISDVHAADELDTTYATGVWRELGGVYFTTGNMRGGYATGTTNTKFQDKSNVLVFEDRLVNSALYDIEVVDNSTGTTEFTLGEKSGTGATAKGVEGSLIRVSDLTQTPIPTVTATDADITHFKLYGTTFLGCGAMDFPPAATDIEALNCNFERCGEIDIDTMKGRGNNLISSQSSTLGAVMIDKTGFDWDECNFIGCNRAVRFPSGSQNTYDFYDLTFSNNTYDIRNEVLTGNTVTINKNGTSDPSTSEEPNGGTTSILASYPETVTCKNTSGIGIEGVRVRIEKQSDGSLVDEGTTNASGVFTDTYGGSTPLDVNVIVRLKGFKFSAAEATITTDGLDVPFTMIRDEAVNLP